MGSAWAAAMLMPHSSTATASKLVMTFIGVSFELLSKPEWLLPMRSRTDRIYSRPLFENSLRRTPRTSDVTLRLLLLRESVFGSE